MQEIGIIKSEKYLTIWSPVLPVFPGAQSASFLISALAPFRVCWKSAITVASDFILVEADGEQQFFIHSEKKQDEQQGLKKASVARVGGAFYKMKLERGPEPNQSHRTL